MQALDDDYLAAEKLDITLNEIRDIEQVASRSCDCVWEAEGATEEWRHMKELMDPFRQVVSIITQLWDLCVSDPFHTQDLERFRDEGKLIIRLSKHENTISGATLYLHAYKNSALVVSLSICIPRLLQGKEGVVHSVRYGNHTERTFQIGAIDTGHPALIDVVPTFPRDTHIERIIKFALGGG